MAPSSMEPGDAWIRDTAATSRRITWQLPNGQQFTSEPRGVYVRNAPRRGPAGLGFALYVVDSAGTERGERVVPATATADDYDQALADLWALLDRMDPVGSDAPPVLPAKWPGVGAGDARSLLSVSTGGNKPARGRPRAHRPLGIVRGELGGRRTGRLA